MNEMRKLIETIEKINEDEWIVDGPHGMPGDEGFYIRNTQTDEFYLDSNGDEWYSYHKSNAQRKAQLLSRGIDTKQKLQKPKFQPDTIRNTYGTHGVPQR